MPELSVPQPRPVPFGRPFAKGVSGCPGGKRREVARVQRALAKMHVKAAAKLELLIDSDEPALFLEGLKLWFRYMVPVPTDSKAVAEVVRQELGVLRPALAARLAELDA